MWLYVGQMCALLHNAVPSPDWGDLRFARAHIRHEGMGTQFVLLHCHLVLMEKHPPPPHLHAGPTTITFGSEISWLHCQHTMAGALLGGLLQALCQETEAMTIQEHREGAPLCYSLLRADHTTVLCNQVDQQLGRVPVAVECKVGSSCPNRNLAM